MDAIDDGGEGSLDLVLEDRSIGYGPHFRYELDRASSSSSSSDDLLSIRYDTKNN